MADPTKLSGPTEQEPPSYTGPERRAGTERRRKRNAEPPGGLAERRMRVRRKSDRMTLEATALGPGGRSHQRVRIEVPVVCQPLASASIPNQPALRGITHTLAPGGLGMLLEEGLRVGTRLEVLVRFGGDLLAADVEVLSVLPQGGKFLHNCRFTRLGEADRKWLTQHLRGGDAPPAPREEKAPLAP